MLTIKPWPYQHEAIELILREEAGLVAYDMGLGKTLVSIAVAEELLGEGEIDQALCIVPSAIKWQWAQKISEYTDVPTRQMSLRGTTITVPTEDTCTIVTGTPAQRKAKYDYIRNESPDYVLVSYEQVVNDWKYIKKIAADLVIVDECTAIKSFKAKRSKRVKELQSTYRIGLSGTPLENRPEEVYSIMEWIAPGYLGRFDLFDKTYIVRDYWGGVKKYKNLDLLHKKLNPIMARKTRRDPDVAPYLPETTHSDVTVEISGPSTKLYDVIADELVDDLHEIAANSQGWFDLAAYYSGDTDGDSAQGRAMSKVMALQMLCDHPMLLDRSAEKFRESLHAPLYASVQGSQYAYELKRRIEEFPKTSPKLERVVEDVRDIMDSASDNKVIVFSFFKGMLDILRERLDEYGSVLFTGDLNTSQKAEAQARFQTDPGCRVFLSSDAGGYGLDLPQANYLLNVDLPWSAGKLAQRNARHVRAGSEWDDVYVVNYIVAGSIEERMAAALRLKSKVSAAVVDGHATDLGEVDNDLGSLVSYLETVRPSK